MLDKQSTSTESAPVWRILRFFGLDNRSDKDSDWPRTSRSTCAGAYATSSRASACECKACAAMGDLDFKFVVHHGEVVKQKMDGREELADVT
jgi:Protein of unknown function (DUF2652)